MRFNKSLTLLLNRIKNVLPYNYSKKDILSLFKKTYSDEWGIINERYKQYKEKDNFLEKNGKKKRYYPTPPDEYLYRLPKVKHMLSKGQRELHKINFNKKECLAELKILEKNVKSRTSKLNKKINKNKEYIQEVEPLYLDIFIQAYHRKGITIEDKMEIFKELQKYECEKSINFFYKINDSERNKQVRRMAFDHLKSLGKYAQLRKNFKGKQKTYMTERTSFNMKPIDLLKRIEEDTIQNKKSFDFFISHSSLDNKIVKNIIKYLNNLKLHVYCDWFNDIDFLRRKYASEYTKIVLKKRIEQSKKILFIRTPNTNDKNKFLSEWIEMEIMYARKIKKDIECINLIDDIDCEFKIYEDRTLMSKLKEVL